MVMRTGQRLTIIRPLTVVQVLGNGEYGVVQRIPYAAVVRYCGPSQMSQMVDIEWQSELYSAFEEDVADRTTPFSTGESAGTRHEEAGSKISFHYPGV
jgi:hypothetical protein